MKRFISLPLPLLIASLALLALPQLAAAETPTGRPVITVPLGEKGSGLRAKGVKITSFGGGVIYNANSVGLLVSDISVGGTQRMNLVLRGGVRLKSGRRSVTIKGMFVQVRSRSVSISAKVGSRRIALATGKLKSPAKLDAARISASFAVGRMELTKNATRYLRSKLSAFSPRTRTLGKLAGNAFVVPPPQTGAVTPPTTAYSCLPVAAGADPAKPVTAIDLSCGYLVLNTRDSWTSYVELNTPIAPASSLPAIDGKDHVCPDQGTAGVVDAYSFSLPVKSGWWDTASGKGYIATAGGVHYHSDERGIDVTIKDLELVVDGASSTAYATTTESDNPTPQRIPFATFNPSAPLSGAAPAPGVPLSRQKLTLTTEAISGPFGWYYQPGSGFGCADFGFNF